MAPAANVTGHAAEEQEEDEPGDGQADKPTEWHYSAAHTSELTNMKQEIARLASEQAAAHSRMKQIEAEAEQEEAEILEKAAKADAFRVAEFSSLRERLAEVKDASDDALLECDAKAEALGEAANKLRDARYETERGMKEEAKKVEAIMRRIEEIDVSERELMSQHERLMSERREESRRKLQKLSQETRARAAALEKQSMEDLYRVQEQIREAKAGIHDGLKQEVLRRQQAMKAADDDIHRVDKAVNEGLGKTKSQVQDLYQSTREKVSEVQSRDFAFETELAKKVADSVSNLEAATEARHMAEAAHRESTKQRQGTAESFGGIFPRSTNFNLFGGRSSPPSSR
eukprot:TRINITY_DN90609_c0_g1_i1.p1 TRINITY_DN90609_c0_g1~~TRINITY_DN90609_c0_g1_i1.p1  ORF type:complete len:344 (-),score=96.56 TRINITY_DN90609_c0_g1_i1:302-1333(-)